MSSRVWENFVTIGGSPGSFSTNQRWSGLLLSAREKANLFNRLFSSSRLSRGMVCAYLVMGCR